MFRPLSLAIALRYIISKKRFGFISLISNIALIGIALSVMILITVLSVMNGFDFEIRKRIANSVPNIMITSLEGNLHLDDYLEIKSQLLDEKNIHGIAPYIEKYLLLSVNGKIFPALVKGIDFYAQSRVDNLDQNIIVGMKEGLNKGDFKIMLGANLASLMQVRLGEKINLLTPNMNITPFNVGIRSRTFTTESIFIYSDSFGLANNFAYINLSDAQKLFLMKDEISGIRLKVDDILKAPQIAQNISAKIGFSYLVESWADTMGSFYHAIKMEKTIIFFILILLIVISIFNLVTGLLMLVNDKKMDIAILKTFANIKLVKRIFIIQGLVISLSGIILGNIGGVALAYKITDIVNFIQSFFNVDILSQVFIIDYLPSKIKISDLIIVSGITLFFSFLATIYPSHQASKIQIVEGLKNE